MKRGTLFWAVLFALLAAGAGAWHLARGAGGTTARVYVDGAQVASFDLSAAAVPYERTIETEYGYNILRISHGAIEVAEADCPEQTCVRQGAITDGLLPIVCLPHHLVIEIGETEP